MDELRSLGGALLAAIIVTALLAACLGLLWALNVPAYMQ